MRPFGNQLLGHIADNAFMRQPSPQVVVLRESEFGIVTADLKGSITGEHDSWVDKAGGKQQEPARSKVSNRIVAFANDHSVFIDAIEVATDQDATRAGYEP